jgi:hypothetical protein
MEANASAGAVVFAHTKREMPECFVGWTYRSLSELRHAHSYDVPTLSWAGFTI